MTSPSTAGQKLSDVEILEYASSLAGELADMARRQRHDLLAYLLAMAHEEARRCAARAMVSHAVNSRAAEHASDEIRIG